MQTRLARITPDERTEVERLDKVLASNPNPDPTVLARIGDLMSKADSFDPIDHTPNDEVDINAYKAVWPEAAKMRRNGMLLPLASGITCPVAAIHGDYDPHPASGVIEPLSSALSNFEFIRLESCGHTPWQERRARGEFFKALRPHMPSS